MDSVNCLLFVVAALIGCVTSLSGLVWPGSKGPITAAPVINAPLQTPSSSQYEHYSPMEDPYPVAVTSQQLVGRWYTQVYIPPASWYGANRFSNMVQDIVAGPESLMLYDTWRVDQCVNVQAQLTPTETPGKYILTDNIGDVNSGDYVIVAIESWCFHVVWGCVKRHSVSNDCLVHWVAAKSRKRHPSPEEIQKIVTILNAMEIKHFNVIDHSNPCPQSSGPKY